LKILRNLEVFIFRFKIIKRLSNLKTKSIKYQIRTSTIHIILNIICKEKKKKIWKWREFALYIWVWHNGRKYRCEG